MTAVKTKKVLDEFRSAFEQEESAVTERRDFIRQPKESAKTQIFKKKYRNLEKYVDTFTPQDLLSFFKEKAKEANLKYISTNAKKDFSIFKKLMEKDLSQREICIMIEFLFSEEQKYLKKTELQPSILISPWCNTILSDSKLWFNDEPVPVHDKKKKPVAKPKHAREWSEVEEDSIDVAIGEWE